MASVVSVYPIHDHALTVSFPFPIGEEAHKCVMHLYHALQEKPLLGISEIVPAYNSIAVYFNDTINWREKKHELEVLANSLTFTFTHPETATPAQFISIPVCYEEPYATDLDIVCSLLSLTKKEVIQLHTAETYKVYMNGFVPGFAYMGELNNTLQVPRKQTPSAKIAAGSIAIAGAQTGIYPFEVPGGWHVIGRTPLAMFNKNRIPVCLLQPGHKVQFRIISKEEFENWT